MKSRICRAVSSSFSSVIRQDGLLLLRLAFGRLEVLRRHKGADPFSSRRCGHWRWIQVGAGNPVTGYCSAQGPSGKVHYHQLPFAAFCIRL